MNSKCLIIFNLAVVRLGSLLSPSQQLPTTSQKLNEPFDLPPDQQMTIYLVSSYDAGQVREGVALQTRSFLAPDKPFSEESFQQQFKQLPPLPPTLADGQFIEKARHLFSNPLVQRVVFEEWREEESGKLLKDGALIPSFVLAVIPGPDGQSLRIEYNHDSLGTKREIHEVQFYRMKRVPFAISGQKIQEIVNFISGLSLPEWMADQIAAKLAFDIGRCEFRVALPPTPHQAAQLNREFLEFRDEKALKKKQKVDFEAGIAVIHHQPSKRRAEALIINRENKVLSFVVLDPGNPNLDSLEISCRKIGKGSFQVSADKLAEVIFEMSGVHVPGPQALKLSQALASPSEEESYSIQILNEIDDWIWRWAVEQANKPTKA